MFDVLQAWNPPLADSLYTTSWKTYFPSYCSGLSILTSEVKAVVVLPSLVTVVTPY